MTELNIRVDGICYVGRRTPCTRTQWNKGNPQYILIQNINIDLAENEVSKTVT
jgi:hypothetical protein